MNNEIKFALLSAFTFSMWVLIEHFTGLNTIYFEKGEPFRLIAGFIPWIFIFIGIRNRKMNLQGGSITFFEGIRSGLIIALLGAILIAFFLWLYVNFINTRMNELAIAFEHKKMVEAKFTQEQINEQLKGIKQMYNGSFESHLSLAVLFSSTGILIAAVCSLFLRTRKRNSQFQ